MNFARPGSQSPPLPPPPPPEEEHQDFGRPRTSAGQGQLAPIVPDDQNLPGWVPKNYIEKGNSMKTLNERLLQENFTIICLLQWLQFMITMPIKMMNLAFRRVQYYMFLKRTMMAGGKVLWMVLLVYSLAIMLSHAFKSNQSHFIYKRILSNLE